MHCRFISDNGHLVCHYLSLELGGEVSAAPHLCRTSLDQNNPLMRDLYLQRPCFLGCGYQIACTHAAAVSDRQMGSGWTAACNKGRMCDS